MKFTVRQGFVVHDVRVVEQGNKKVEQENSYYENDTVDFDEASALKHLHKLEPIDKAAIAFCAARFVPEAPPQVAGGMDAAAVAALIASAVAQALAAVQAPAAAPATLPKA